MKKSIMVLLVAAALLIAFVGCTPAASTEPTVTPTEIITQEPTPTPTPTPAPLPDAKSLMNAANEKMAGITGIDLSFEAVTNIKAGDSEIVTKTGIHMLMPDITASVPEASVESTASFFGNETKVSYYFSPDGKIYCDDGETKYVTEGTIGDSGVIPDIDISSDMVEFSDSIFAKATVSELDGGYRIDIALSAEDISALADEMKEFFEQMGIGESGFEEFSMALIIDGNGYLTKASAIAKITAEQDGSQYTADVAFEIVINNPGQPVTVTPPADLDEYVEYDFGGVETEF